MKALAYQTAPGKPWMSLEGFPPRAISRFLMLRTWYAVRAIDEDGSMSVWFSHEPELPF